MNATEARIIAMLKEHLTEEEMLEEEITMGSNLVEVGMNSVNFVKFAVSLETEFQFEFGYDDLNLSKYETVKDMYEYVLSQCNEQGE